MQGFKKHLEEKLKASDDMGTWVKDFQDSDAPQFKGKTKEKKREMAIAAKLSAERNEEVELDEAVEVSHARYLRSHGKKASGGHGLWMFTHKRMGDVDHNNDKEVHQASGKFSDAAKSAKAWAKKHGHDTAYVMEEVSASDIANAGRSLPAKAGNTKAYYASKASDEAQPKSKVSLKKAPWEKNEEVELDESAAAAAAKMMIDRDDEDRRRQTRRWDAEDAAKKSSASKKQTSKPETPAERKARRHAADQVHFGEVATHHRTKAAEHEKMAKEHDKKTKGISGKLFGGKHKEAAKLNNAAAQAHHKAAEVADKVHKAAGGKKTSYSSQDAYHKHNDAAIRASGDVHTHKLTKMRESVELGEVLDRPGALDSYRKKADASGNKARNSATRKILTAPKNGERPDHSDELKTMRKRNRGQDMADRVAVKQFRKSIGRGYTGKND